MSMIAPSPDIKPNLSAPPESVHHAYCPCQDARPEQRAVCGYRPTKHKSIVDAPKTPPDDACVVCLDLMYAPRNCCGRAR
jgi:hypothetical protein